LAELRTILYSLARGLQLRCLADKIIGTEIKRVASISALVTCIPSFAPAARIAKTISLVGIPQENWTIGAPASKRSLERCRLDPEDVIDENGPFVAA